MFSPVLSLPSRAVEGVVSTNPLPLAITVHPGTDRANEGKTEASSISEMGLGVTLSLQPQLWEGQGSPPSDQLSPLGLG